jgi:methionine transaminase
LNSSLTLKTKFPKSGISIFTRMTDLANEHKAINLSQGFPDMLPDKRLLNWVSHFMEKGKNQYSPTAGILPLRERISNKIKKLYSAEYNPETEITIVPGATLGIFAAISAIIRENDEVIIFEQAYDSYIPAIENNGGKIVFAELDNKTFKPDWAEVKKLINSKTKLIVINSPHNPSGSFLSADDMLKLQKITKDTDILILSDEVYEHIIFDNYEHQSVARYPELAKRSFIISSFGKTYHATGWKLGYVVAPEFMMTEFRKIYQYMAFCANTPMQYGFYEVLKHESLYLELGHFFQKKRDLFQSAVKASNFKITPCHSTYFQLLNFKKISDQNDLEFSEWLTKEKKLAAIPVSEFYRRKNDYGNLRFCFAKEDDVLKKAGDILCSI